MKSMCVFCASSFGEDSQFVKAAQMLGRTLAEHQVTLVYGGANVGLMGAVADSTLEHGGKVIGVLPRFLQEKELAHKGLSELILCETMHERKIKMFELSQGFIALPGGFGTLEEVIEILTWRQLGLHSFPVGFLNVSGFYSHLQMLFAEMERKKLLKSESQKTALFSDDVTDLFTKMQSHNDHETGTLVQRYS